MNALVSSIRLLSRPTVAMATSIRTTQRYVALLWTWHFKLTFTGLSLQSLVRQSSTLL
jgi:hypothetical protein